MQFRTIVRQSWGPGGCKFVEYMLNERTFRWERVGVCFTLPNVDSAGEAGLLFVACPPHSLHNVQFMAGSREEFLAGMEQIALCRGMPSILFVHHETGALMPSLAWLIRRADSILQAAQESR